MRQAIRDRPAETPEERKERREDHKVGVRINRRFWQRYGHAMTEYYFRDQTSGMTLWCHILERYAGR